MLNLDLGVIVEKVWCLAIALSFCYPLPVMGQLDK